MRPMRLATTRPGLLRHKSDSVAKEDVSSQLILRVAVIGLPNCGKSTLVNQLMGQKLFAVSPKVHTTQQMTLGGFVEDNRQVVLLDTPGVVNYQYGRRLKLSRAMMTDAHYSCMESDVVMTVVDASNQRTREIAEPQIVDKVKHKTYLLQLADILTGREKQHSTRATHWDQFSDVYMLSALTGDGVDNLKQHLLAHCQPGEWMLDADQFTDTPTKKLVEDTIREKLFIHLHQELPYIIKQENVYWEEYADGSLSIYQNLICTKDCQKRILIGKEGKVIKTVATEAITDLEKAFGRTVRLFLYVMSRKPS
ncbi:GTPase Era-like isoform X2 [Dysidea avara]|uniref:GTPase Era-like isoform X2 n=1 Tax=Dysidea avara TaxID=196820 RepID=UPI00331AF6DD